MFKRSKKLIERVSERTGLKTENEILAYMNFVDESDWEDGLILTDNVKYNFYTNLIKKSNSKIREEEERKFYSNQENYS